MRDKGRYFLIASVFVLLLGAPSKVGGWQNFTVYGYVQWASPPALTQSQTQSKPAQPALTILTAKLSYPMAKGKPALVTYPAAGGDFRFPNLPKGSYLLEIYYGNTKKPIYDRRLTVESDQMLAIPIGAIKSVCSVTIQEGETGLLGAEFQNRVAIAIGKIDLRKDGSALALTVGPAAGRALSRQSRPYFRGTLPPLKLIASFKYNNRTYTLAGAIRSSQNQRYFDGEVYR
jgi:hypothetical protein